MVALDIIFMFTHGTRQIFKETNFECQGKEKIQWKLEISSAMNQISEHTTMAKPIRMFHSGKRYSVDRPLNTDRISADFNSSAISYLS